MTSHFSKGALPQSAKADKSATTAHAAESGNITLVDIHRLLMEVLEKVSNHETKKALRLRDVTEKTGFGKSHIHAMGNPKYAAYDPSWPRPFYIGNSPRWLESSVSAWLDAKALASRTAH